MLKNKKILLAGTVFSSVLVFYLCLKFWGELFSYHINYSFDEGLSEYVTNSHGEWLDGTGLKEIVIDGQVHFGEIPVDINLDKRQAAVKFDASGVRKIFIVNLNEKWRVFTFGLEKNIISKGDVISLFEQAPSLVDEYLGIAYKKEELKSEVSATWE